MPKCGYRFLDLDTAGWRTTRFLDLGTSGWVEVPKYGYRVPRSGYWFLGLGTACPVNQRFADNCTVFDPQTEAIEHGISDKV